MTTARRDIEGALHRLNALMGAKDLGILHAFDDDADVLLVGSEIDEVVQGPAALRVFFENLFAQDVSIGWDWSRIDTGAQGNILWFFAEGQVVLDRGRQQDRRPYRLSGVLVRRDGTLRWRQFHGSEPKA